MREIIDDLHRLDAHGDDALDQVDDVARVVVLVAPVVGSLSYPQLLFE